MSVVGHIKNNPDLETPPGKDGVGEADVDRMATGLIYRNTHHLPLDELIVAAHRYVGLTAEQVRAAFAKWLRPACLVEVIQGPPPERYPRAIGRTCWPA